MLNDRLPIVRKFLSLPYTWKISLAYKRSTSLIWVEQARKIEFHKPEMWRLDMGVGGYLTT